MTSHSIQPADIVTVERAGETLSAWQQIGFHISKTSFGHQRLIGYAIDAHGRVVSCWYASGMVGAQQ